MVAEDNPGVRRLVSSFLAGLGYTVHAAADGGEALRIAESLDQPVHLLISDVGLPILNGIGLADRLRDRWPDLKVLLASGYAASTLVQTESLRLGANFIAKPFKVVELALIVRRTLDGAP
jgi:CheY-like chemotaxis protein